MDTLFALTALAGLSAMVWFALVAYFSKMRRRKAKIRAWGSFIIFVLSIAAISHFQNADAVAEGFKSTSDRMAAKNAGFTDSFSWRSEQLRRDRELIQQAEENETARRIQESEAAKRQQQKDEELAKAEAAEEEEREKKAAEQKLKEDEVAKAEAALAEEAVRAKEAACLADPQCAFDELSIQISVDCRLAIEKLPKWDFEWTDSWTEPKFLPAGWAKKDQKTLLLMGQALKLQNGFGAWKRVSYFCAYNLVSRKVVDVVINQ
ncbi:hypothetical protein IFT84_10115 [Rhizobium sp. CFBP 8762]|uniref:hypothetical protein n=1 Tax=Rhizobium sp. CFBP 8762 TaxID=2775279 RepID=UPI00177CE4CA|nr:hypothetical protein [Rhizobium sp. CFBP 8762]MBD8554878.1 hypothetical protein [Rhizobium sp. CFBP 8762]